MFNCISCKSPVGPNVSPIRRVTGTRNVEYHNEFYREDEWGTKRKVEVDSVGSEITGEELLCPDCAKEDSRAPNSVKVIGGNSFQEKLATPLKVLLLATVVQSMLDRLEHGSVRAKQDTETVIPSVKAYVDANPKLVF